MKDFTSSLKKWQRIALLVSFAILGATVGYIIYSFNQWVEDLVGYSPYEILFFLFLIFLAAFAATAGYLSTIEVFSHLK